MEKSETYSENSSVLCSNHGTSDAVWHFELDNNTSRPTQQIIVLIWQIVMKCMLSEILRCFKLIFMLMCQNKVISCDDTSMCVYWDSASMGSRLSTAEINKLLITLQRIRESVSNYYKR